MPRRIACFSKRYLENLKLNDWSMMTASPSGLGFPAFWSAMVLSRYRSAIYGSGHPPFNHSKYGWLFGASRGSFGIQLLMRKLFQVWLSLISGLAFRTYGNPFGCSRTAELSAGTTGSGAL